MRDAQQAANGIRREKLKARRARQFFEQIFPSPPTTPNSAGEDFLLRRRERPPCCHPSVPSLCTCACHCSKLAVGYACPTHRDQDQEVSNLTFGLFCRLAISSMSHYISHVKIRSVADVKLLN